VHLEGALEHRSYESNGSTRYVTEVVLRPFNGSIGMLGAAPSRPAGENAASRPTARETSQPK
jgi:single-stranded DNA-binding protein